MNRGGMPMNPENSNQNLMINIMKSKIGNMKREDKIKLLRYLKNLKEEEGELFVQFLQQNQWIIDQFIKN